MGAGVDKEVQRHFLQIRKTKQRLHSYISENTINKSVPTFGLALG